MPKVPKIMDGYHFKKNLPAFKGSKNDESTILLRHSANSGGVLMRNCAEWNKDENTKRNSVNELVSKGK